MTNIKLTRWATYLVPGSVIMVSIWILAKTIYPKALDMVVRPPTIPGIDVYVFLALSYIIGIGLWGVCYSEPTQKWLRFNSHNKRVLLVKEFLQFDWRQKKYASILKKHFPDLPQAKEDIASFDYSDFEFIIANVHDVASTEMNDRVVQGRETIGLLQTLILGLRILTICLFVSAISQALGRCWLLATGSLCAALAVLALTRMLYIHYDCRQRYLVRDTIMAFLSQEV